MPEIKKKNGRLAPENGQLDPKKYLSSVKIDAIYIVLHFCNKKNHTLSSILIKISAVQS